MLKFLATFLATAAAAAAVAQTAQTTLKVSAIPDENPTELQRKFTPLGKYLEAKTGMKVEFIPVTDYAATVEGLAAKKIDMVWYGGFTFVQTNCAATRPRFRSYSALKTPSSRACSSPPIPTSKHSPI